MKVLVTGGAGFVGSFLARELLRRGDDVVVIDNFSDYYSKRAKLFNVNLTRYFAGQNITETNINKIKEISNKLESFNKKRNTKGIGNYEFIKLDIRNKNTLEILFKREKFDKIVHLAAMAGVTYSIKQPLLYTEVNVDGTVNLLELSVKYLIKKFLFASSSSVYGSSKNNVFEETQNTDKPISVYAATKRMAEIACYTYHYLYKLPIIVARMFGPVYGPLQRPYGMAAQKFIRQADNGFALTIYGDGSMKRDSTYIDDEVTGLISALDSDIDFETINIGSGKPISVSEMAQKTIKYFGKGRIEYKDLPLTEVPATCASTKKAKRLLKFKAKISYDEGIKRQIEIYRLMPDWYRKLEI